MINIYLICCIISLIFLFGYFIANDRFSYNIIAMMVVVIVSNGGYFFLSIAKGLDDAVLATKLTYVAGCFLPMLVFLSVLEVCQIQLKKYVISVMYVIQLVLFGLVCTIGYSEIYYKTVSFKQVYGLAALDKTYGPYHVFYLITLMYYFLMSIVVTIVSFRRKNVVSIKNVALVFVAYLMGIGGYLVDRAFNLPISLIPIADTFLFCVIIFPMNRINNYYYIRENVNRVNEQKNDICFISFSTELEYMGCNDKAREVFPEIKEFKIDKPIPKSDSVFYSKVLRELENYKMADHYEELCIERLDKKWKLMIHPIRKKTNILMGYLVEFSDVTEQQKYIDMVENFNTKLKHEVEEKTKSVQDMRTRMTQGFDYSDTAYAIIKVEVDDEGKPEDWIFVYLNDAMARLQGVRKDELENKRFLETFEDGNRKWLNYYYPAAYEDKTFVFEDSPQLIGVYMRVQCFPLDHGYCGCIMEDANSNREILRSKAEVEMINEALCSDYFMTYVVDLDTGITHLHEKSGIFRTTENNTFKRGHFDELAKVLVAGDYVESGDKSMFNAVRSFEKLKEVMDANQHYVLSYRAIYEGKRCQMETHFAKTFDGNKRYCVIAIKDITDRGGGQ